MEGEHEVWPEGVTPLDHTADVGLVVRALSRVLLFERAAAGMRALIEGAGAGADAPEPRGSRAIELEADDVASLLVAWLRELLFLHQVEGLALEGVRFTRLDDTGLEATLSLAAAATRPAREIKGVTYHGLAVTADERGWRAR
ncbi:MAG: archease, partial [Gemmatimonadota bacterium]